MLVHRLPGGGALLALPASAATRRRRRCARYAPIAARISLSTPGSANTLLARAIAARPSGLGCDVVARGAEGLELDHDDEGQQQAEERGGDCRARREETSASNPSRVAGTRAAHRPDREQDHCPEHRTDDDERRAPPPARQQVDDGAHRAGSSRVARALRVYDVADDCLRATHPRKRHSRADGADAAGPVRLVLRDVRGRVAVRDCRHRGHRPLRRAHVLQGHREAPHGRLHLGRDRRHRRRVQRVHRQGVHGLLREVRCRAPRTSRWTCSST